MVLRLALDQNFPTPLLQAVADYLPAEVELLHVHRIDSRLPALSDRDLFIALNQLGWDGLVTNNYKMLSVPEEIAAIICTRAVVLAVKGLGHDPLRAAGALLLDLPGLANRLRPGVSNVFLLDDGRSPRDGWEYLKEAARKRNHDQDQLWELVRVTDAELGRSVLPSTAP